MKFILVIGVIVIFGALMVGFRMYRDRSATSMEETMRQFQRGLEALDPSNDPLTRRENNRNSSRATTPANTPLNTNPSGRRNDPTQER